MPTVTQTSLFMAMLVSYCLHCSLAHAQRPIAQSALGTIATDIPIVAPSALLKSAEAAMRAKDWELALRRLDLYLALKPADALGHRRRGWSLGEVGRSDEALAAYRKSTELAPRKYASGQHTLKAC